MTSRFRVASTLPRRLEELGISPLMVLRHAGLPSGLFSQEKILISAKEIMALRRGISAVSSDPATGLKLGIVERPELYDLITIAALSTRSFRDALHCLARYKLLTCPEKIEITETADECCVRFTWLSTDEPKPALTVDGCFARILAIGRRGISRMLSPKRVEFQRPAAHREMYQAHFQCPVKFGAPQNLLVLRNADVDEPLVTHNADLLGVVAPQLEAELTHQLVGKTIGEQTKSALKRIIAGRRPVLQDAARELRLSARTLQRRLTEEGLNFQRVLQDARRELARHYLLRSSVGLNETAYLLGYEDSNSFFRAFHVWEGKSPGEWRASQMTPVEDVVAVNKKNNLRPRRIAMAHCASTLAFSASETDGRSASTREEQIDPKRIHFDEFN
jgi:AraC-like DNA-binding protein